MAFKSTHNLPLEVAEYHIQIDPSRVWKKFRIGTVEGLWSSTPYSIDVLAIDNKQPHNGHFNDAMEWLEYCCRHEKRNLRFLEVWNMELKIHFITKRGFFPDGADNVIKYFI